MFERVAGAGANQSETPTAPASRSSSAAPSSRKARQDPKVAELLNSYATVEELKAKLELLQTEDTSAAAVSDKSICNINHERASASAVAQAFKKREEIEKTIEDKQVEIVKFDEDFKEHVEMVREECRVMRDALDAEQERMMQELRDQKSELRVQFKAANEVLQKAHEEQIVFYNKSLPKAEPAQPMKVDRPTMPPESPTHAVSQSPALHPAEDPDDDGLPAARKLARTLKRRTAGERVTAQARVRRPLQELQKRLHFVSRSSTRSEMVAIHPATRVQYPSQVGIRRWSLLSATLLSCQDGSM